MTEEWRSIPGYEGCYEASNHGGVRGLDRWVAGPGGSRRRIHGKILSQAVDAEKRHAVSLNREGRARTRRVHQLVMEAFVGPRPPRHQVAHWDGNPENNLLENLRYATQAQNEGDKFRHGTRARVLECLRGHEYTEENSRWFLSSRGYRVRECWTCRRLSDRGELVRTGR